MNFMTGIYWFNYRKWLCNCYKSQRRYSIPNRINRWLAFVTVLVKIKIGLRIVCMGVCVCVQFAVVQSHLPRAIFIGLCVCAQTIKIKYPFYLRKSDRYITASLFLTLYFSLSLPMVNDVSSMWLPRIAQTAARTQLHWMPTSMG